MKKLLTFSEFLNESRLPNLISEADRLRLIEIGGEMSVADSDEADETVTKRILSLMKLRPNQCFTCPTAKSDEAAELSAADVQFLQQIEDRLRGTQFDFAPAGKHRIGSEGEFFMLEDLTVGLFVPRQGDSIIYIAG
jgi:hypothetical protein